MKGLLNCSTIFEIHSESYRSFERFSGEESGSHMCVLVSHCLRSRPKMKLFLRFGERGQGSGCCSN